MNDFAIFFDRDGIVNQRLYDNYVKSTKDFVFQSDFFDTIRIAKEYNFLLFLITNQQGIGKGLMSESDLNQIHHYMNSELIRITGITFNEIFFCSSLDSSNDYRRKPNPGMILEAIEKYKLTKNKCIFIGDSKLDVLAGINAGINTIFIGQEKLKNISPSFTFESLNELNKTLSEILVRLKQGNIK